MHAGAEEFHRRRVLPGWSWCANGSEYSSPRNLICLFWGDPPKKRKTRSKHVGLHKNNKKTRGCLRNRHTYFGGCQRDIARLACRFGAEAGFGDPVQTRKRKKRRETPCIGARYADSVCVITIEAVFVHAGNLAMLLDVDSSSECMVHVQSSA